jgi:hypothetical protein
MTQYPTLFKDIFYINLPAISAGISVAFTPVSFPFFSQVCNA